MKKQTDNGKKTAVAIIGMGCFFPKAAGVKQYWRLLFQGIDAITEVPDSHWSAMDYFDSDPKKPDHVYCTRGGFLSPIDFDPVEFGIPPASLQATDTSQLLGLACAKAALSDAGYGEDHPFDRDRTSVILGVTGTQELVIPLSSRLGHPIWRKALQDSGLPPQKIFEIVQKISNAYVPWQENSFPGLLGNVVAGRISNRLNLGGTNCVVDAACASSLSAVHLAVMELISVRADMVVTGGVDTLNDIFMHMCFSKTGVLSPSGNASPFSDIADGTVLGEGIGMLVLKRLEDAERDHDRVYAVIKALGSSSDGKSQSIYAPRIEGQMRALQQAYHYADIDPKTVELIEAHGTGTRVGDKVEFEALHRFMEASGKSADGRCALGSVKSMIGHTKAAAGIAGMIKAALALHHKVLPPTLKADNPDPELGIHKSAFYLNTETRPWFRCGEHPRRSGVSAFGFGGSNFHAVLEEYHGQKESVSWDGSVEIFALSARSKEILQTRLTEAGDRIRDGIPSAAVAAQSRQAFSSTDAHRILLRLDLTQDLDAQESISALFGRAAHRLSKDGFPQEAGVSDVFYGNSDPQDRIALMFPGQGCQYVGMGKDLVCVFPEAIAVLESADAVYASKPPLSRYVYPLPAYPGETKSFQESRLRSTDIAQPAIGAVTLSLLKILTRFGITPDAVCGHSFGELTALCAAGWIDANTALKLAVYRGKYMAAANAGSSGAMLAVSAPLTQLERVAHGIGPDIALANRNSPTQGVLSGTMEAVEAADDRCRRLGFRTKRLPVSAAFHTRFMEPARDPFRQMVSTIAITPTDIPVLSNQTGTLYTKNAEAARSILCEQLVHPVDFIGNVNTLYDLGIRTFVEVGPGSVLTGLIRSILSDRSIHAFSVDASNGRGSGVSDLAAALCRLAALGYPVDLKQWEDPVTDSGRQRMTVSLTGANYRPSCDDPDSTSQVHTDIRHDTGPMPPDPNRTSQIDSIRIDKDCKAIQFKKEHTFTKPMEYRSKHPESIADALRVAQEGLRSMQALQLQTADAHKKFLETQAEAARSIQEMMRATQRMTRSLAGEESVPMPSDAASEYPSNLSVNRIEPEPLTIEKGLNADTPMYESEISSYVPDSARSDSRPKGPEASGGDVQRILLNVVSRLTGYPTEMLDMEMDIESDLGIDSIKRVEILSTLEETLPGIPKISPDQLGTLKTLGQIADFLTEANPAMPQRPPVEEATDDISTTLLLVVSRLTGYPTEMLDMEMNIESDLGIDSIKRVEILSTLEETLPGIPKVSPDQLGTLKTLGQIADFLNREKCPSAPISRQIEPTDPCEGIQDKAAVERHIVHVIETPHVPGRRISMPPEHAVFVTPQAGRLSEALVLELKQHGIHAVGLDPDRVDDPGRPKAAGLILLPETDNAAAFRLAHDLGPELRESGLAGGAVFAAVARMDGQFGFSRKGLQDPEQGGLAGLSKTAAIEWPEVLCRAFDIDPGWNDASAVAKAVVAELLDSEDRRNVEIGLAETSRHTLELLPQDCPQGALHLETGDRVVVTGGARGITAGAALALAASVRPTLLILGRSPEPTPEPEWLRDITDEALMKRAILTHEFSGATPTPLALEKAYGNYAANRDISRNLELMRTAGATVVYRPVDVRDTSAVTETLAALRTTYGPIKALIHGAGVLNDRWIVDKTFDQFKAVYDTKVEGLKNLLEATRNDPLAYVILFSSVAGRLGNQGQADYAMANEVLNKMAQQQAAARPGCRIVSINWGPWDGGMVSEGIKKEFVKNGLSLISIESGAAAMLDEMKGHPGDPVEVILGAARLGPSEQPGVRTVPAAGKSMESGHSRENLTLSFKREIDIDRYPILRSHVLDGKPVVPLALIAEWLGNGALHHYPGMVLSGLDGLRLLNGIRMDVERRNIRLFAGKLKRLGSQFAVDVELRDGIQEGREVIHSTATAILSETLASPPDFQKKPVSTSYARSIDEVYEQILFHGDDLRGIRQILSLSSEAMAARILPAPSPDRWMKAPLRSRWILDPLLLDSAFQMATIWCYEERGNVSLPSFCASYRQYCENFPSDEVTAVLEIQTVSDRKMTGNFTFLDDSGTVLARLEGYEAIMDPALRKAFTAG